MPPSPIIKLVLNRLFKKSTTGVKNEIQNIVNGTQFMNTHFKEHTEKWEVALKENRVRRENQV